MTDLFSLHPFTAFLYFLSVFIFVMFSQNPVFSVIAFFGAIAFSATVKKRGARFKRIISFTVLFFAVALTNPLFSHNGVTFLFFINNNPVTAEALYYGIYLAVMLIAVLLWFNSFNAVITDDKWLYLTARVSPKLSLLLSSVLRFVPRIREQYRKIRNAQKAIGLFSTDSLGGRLKTALNIYSALITWGLEAAVDTGASMKARGYGQKNRSNYSQFRMRYADFVVIFLVLLIDLTLIILSSLQKTGYVFYPSINFPALDFCVLTSAISFALLCFLPFILSVKEDIKWHYLKSKI